MSKARDLANSGLILLNTTPLSASSAAQINNVFSSTYNSYRIICDIRGSIFYQMYAQLSNGGTPVGATNYTYASRYWDTNAGAGTAENSGGAAYFTLGFNSTLGSLIAFDIVNPGQALQTTMNGVNSQGSTHRQFGGIHNLTTAYDGIRIAPVSASTMTGNIQVYGYRQ